MDKPTLTDLVQNLQEGAICRGIGGLTLPPTEAGEFAYEYTIEFVDGQFELELTIWKDYYCFSATREQPRDEGWADLEFIQEQSVFLSELLSILEDRGIPLPKRC